MILGIDFSLTATGVCAITDGEAECITIRTAKEILWWQFPDRIALISSQLEEWSAFRAELGDPYLVIESPAFAAKSSSLDRMFGGWWLFVDELMNGLSLDTPLLVTPSQVKKFATGKGNAGKDEVMLATARRYPDVAIANNNEADALTLAAIGAAAYGEPFTGTLSKYQQEVVDAVRAGKETS